MLTTTDAGSEVGGVRGLTPLVQRCPLVLKASTITANGIDIGKAGISTDHLKPYVFDGNRATIPKPDLCK